MNLVDRHRATVATVITIVALLALVVFGDRSSGTNDPSADDATREIGSPTPPPTSAYVPAPAAFMSGDVAPGAVEPPSVLVPPVPSGNSLVVKASFTRYAEELLQPCSTGLVAEGVMITVTNLDNGQRTTCVNIYGKIPPAGSDIVLDTEWFTEIGNLADAPVPVRITW